MKLTLNRTYKGAEYTIGKLYIDNEYFCDTLEDTDRGLNQNMSVEEIKSKKIYAQTCIPTGIYKITLKVKSPTMSKRPVYNFCDGKVPRLLDVKGYDGILIHIGNSAKDSAGCILVGENKVKGMVVNSTDIFKRLYLRLQEAEDEIFIEIK